VSQAMPVVVLISGSGSNLQAIIDGMQAGDLPIDIRAVISNRADAYGLERAKAAGIHTEVVSHRDYQGREDFDRALQEAIDAHNPALVILAGFMRILTRDFVEHYLGRMLNIHPALLPLFPGLNTHERALQDEVKEHGATVHFVTTEVDGGPLVLQARVPVHDDDTPEALAARVLEQEHRIPTTGIDFAEISPD
jgi:phosphoribosylglycinamide formyltransferase-1